MTIKQMRFISSKIGEACSGFKFGQKDQYWKEGDPYNPEDSVYHEVFWKGKLIGKLVFNNRKHEDTPLILWSATTEKGKMLSKYLAPEQAHDWPKAEWDMVYAMALLLIDLED